MRLQENRVQPASQFYTPNTLAYTMALVSRPVENISYIRCFASLTDRDYRRSHSTFCDDFGGRIAPFTITREALSTNLRLFHGDGSEILPAYFSNNYVGCCSTRTIDHHRSSFDCRQPQSHPASARLEHPRHLREHHREYCGGAIEIKNSIHCDRAGLLDYQIRTRSCNFQ